MINTLRKILSLLLLFIATNCCAQKDGRDFKAIDEYVKKLGSLDSLTMGAISNIVTKKYTDKTNSTPNHNIHRSGCKA